MRESRTIRRRVASSSNQRTSAALASAEAVLAVNNFDAALAIALAATTANRDALLAGSAESFALQAVPGLLRPEGAGALRQLLGKDLDHARKLAPESDASMAALVHAAESMLERLDRAAKG